MEGYLRWLTELESPASPRTGWTPDLAVDRHSLTAAGLLVPLLQRFAARFGDPSTRHRATRRRRRHGRAYLKRSAIYRGEADAADPWSGAARSTSPRRARAAEVVLVQTLPFLVHGAQAVNDAVELANAGDRSASPGPPTRGASPVHQVASFDVLVAAEAFERVAEALRALGRHDRAGLPLEPDRGPGGGPLAGACACSGARPEGRHHRPGWRAVARHAGRGRYGGRLRRGRAGRPAVARAVAERAAAAAAQRGTGRRGVQERGGRRDAGARRSRRPTSP